jgi:sugar phosphate isomerase/epimerase
MRENLGLLDHAQWLEEIAPYAAGAHLQDARWPDEDHLVPFQGEIPFDRLVKILPSSLPYILELSRHSKPESIREASLRWESLFTP